MRPVYALIFIVFVTGATLFVSPAVAGIAGAVMLIPFLIWTSRT